MGRIYKFLLLLAMLFTGLVYGQSENTKTLRKYWIFFKDKGEAAQIKSYQSLSGADLGISPRAMAIRTKVRDQNRLIDHTDLPIASEYINTLKSYNLFPRKTSRWLNGVSVFMSADQYNDVSSLSFVKSVQRIRSLSIPTPNSASIGYFCKIEA